MIIVGIDPSLTGTAVCPDAAASVVYRFSSPPCGMSVAARLARYRAMLKHVGQVVPAGALVMLEGYSFGSQGRATLDIAEYGGLLRDSLDVIGCEIIEVPPTSLKKWTTGKGVGDKTGMIAAISRRYDVQFDTSDEYDAYALARLGEQYAGREQPQNQAQREVIEKLKAGPVKKKKKGAG